MYTPTISFRTAIFNTTQEANYFINPGNYGEDVITWLKQGLQKTTPFPVGEVIQEDYGWGVWVTVGRAYYWVPVALVPEPSNPPKWDIVISYDVGCLWFRFLTRPYREEDMQALSDAVERLLRAEPQITEIVWETEK